MAYLVAAVNVRNLGHETRAGIGFTRLSFDIDGPAYARQMRDEMQAEMQRRGDLPPGMSLGVPELYSDMTGSGELWIGDDGLPLRQSLQLEFPPDGGGWNAMVTIKIVDENGDPVVNAAVNGQWSKGFYQSSSCTTDASGQCSVEQTGIGDKTRRVTFTVDNVTHSAFTYDPVSNAVSSVRADRP